MTTLNLFSKAGLILAAKWASAGLGLWGLLTVLTVPLAWTARPLAALLVFVLVIGVIGKALAWQGGSHGR